MNMPDSNEPKELTNFFKPVLIPFIITQVKICLIFGFLFSFFLPLHAQKTNADYRLHIRKTVLQVTIDGIINEEVWKHADVAKDFFMVLPEDTGRASQPSEIRMAYDDKNIYLAAVFYNKVSGPYYVESLRRDFVFGKNDNFLLFLDPFNNQTTGFSFGANAAGAQWDGTMNNGQTVDLNWDSKWISKVTRDKDKWVLEMAIPFKSIRYKKGVKEWGINFSRLDLKTSEKSSWTPIPRQFATASLAFTGVLVWDEPPPMTGTNFSLIPYVLGSVNNNHNSDGNQTTYDTKIGGDVKFALSSALNIDLTINPDFSQVEVDRQIANLDRFELFFPERRQFFLENADLFANFGYANIRPFFSRRIGLEVPIHAGLRVSGNLNENWRMGLMDMQTASDKDIGLPSQNFAAVSFQRKVFSQSSIGVLFVNKESTSYPEDTDEFHELYPKFNRNFGLEYNLASYNNLWTGKAFVFKSFSPEGSGNGFTQAANIEYKTQDWNFGFKEEYVDSDYRAEVGFVPRNSYVKLNPFAGYLFYPKSNSILSHGPKWTSIYYFDEDMKNTDYLNLLQYFVNFRNRSSFKLTFINEYVELLEPFDPTGTGKPELPAGSKHHWNAVRMNYESKPQSMFTYSIGTRVGNYYQDGSWFSLSNELGYRFQPYVSLSSAISYNNISMPAPWNTTEFWLIGAKADVTFTNKLFFATLFQYNEQSKNFNLNSRFQWRYQPASDLFVVYTYNDMLPPLSDRTHTLTLKLVYWFNK